MHKDAGLLTKECDIDDNVRGRRRFLYWPAALSIQKLSAPMNISPPHPSAPLSMSIRHRDGLYACCVGGQLMKRGRGQ